MDMYINRVNPIPPRGVADAHLAPLLESLLQPAVRYICICIYLSIYPSIYPYMFPSIHPSIYLSTYPSIYQSIYLFIRPAAGGTICIYMNIYMCTCVCIEYVYL